MNEVQRNLEELKEAFASEIVKAQTRFVHICLAAIMPKELYDLAAADNQMQRCEAWAKAEGYSWHAVVGELRLIKNGLICARFQPTLSSPSPSTRSHSNGSCVPLPAHKKRFPQKPESAVALLLRALINPGADQAYLLGG